jgi:phage shock protein A
MTVFGEFKRAWREAVDNFWQELEGDDPEGRSRGVYREVAGVRNQLDELDGAIGETLQRLKHEKAQVEACLRRERLARGIGDEETARVAAEYGARHQERAEGLGRKVEALEAERRLCARDLGEMERALQERGPIGTEGELPDVDLNRHPREHEFRNLEDTERNRTAEERLEELKRRMGQSEAG